MEGVICKIGTYSCEVARQNILTNYERLDFTILLPEFVSSSAFCNTLKWLLLIKIRIRKICSFTVCADDRNLVLSVGGDANT